VRTDDPGLLAEQAAAHIRVARIKHTQGRKDEWIPEFQKGIEIATALVDEGATREQLAPLKVQFFTNRDQSQLYLPSDVRAAVKVFQRASKTWSTLVSHYPDVPDFQNDLAGIYHIIASLESDGGESRSAVSPFLRAGAIFEDLVKRFPAEPDYRLSLAVHLGNKALYLNSSGQAGAAIKVLQRAIDLLAKVTAEFPTRSYYKYHLCFYQAILGAVQTIQGHSDEAVATIRNSATGLEDLVAKFPRAIVFRGQLSYAYGWLATALAANRKTDDAIVQARKGFDQLTRLRDLLGEGKENVFQVVRAGDSVGRALSATAQWGDALVAYKYSSELASRLEKDAPNNRLFERESGIALYRLALAQAFGERPEEYSSSCASLVVRLKPDTELNVLDYTASAIALRSNAIKDYAGLLRSYEKHVKFGDSVKTVSRDEWFRLGRLGILFYRAGQYKQSLECLDNWRTIREKKPAFQSEPPYGLFFLAMVHQRLGHKQEAKKWLGQACERCDDALGESTPKDPQRKPKVSGANWHFGETLKVFRREALELILGPKTKPDRTNVTKPQTNSAQPPKLR
jgi:tetratricopeptide (TPR) repeat protein